MSELWRRIRALIEAGNVRISEHGYDALADDNLTVDELLAGTTVSQVVEEYPDFPKGPALLILLQAADGEPVHAVWGIPRGRLEPAVLVTAYRPGPARWDATFMKRRER